MDLRDHISLDIEKTRLYLRLDHNLDDALIEMMWDAAIVEIDSRLNLTEDDEDSLERMIPTIRLAAHRIIASWYEGRADSITRERAGIATVQFGEVPWDAERILHPIRRSPGL